MLGQLRKTPYFKSTFLVFFVIFILFSITSAIKLNVPRVLLPYSQSVSANFTLEVTDGGCFTWHVTRPEVVKLYLLDDDHRQGCSSRAVVTSSTRHTTARQSALVIIRNEMNGDTLHCDVTVASIHKLRITTTTRELLLEDTPEAFTLIAEDKDGDTFSSIDGLVFEWSLVTDTGSDEIIDAYKVLRFMKFSESLYKASASIYNLESQGLQGYTMLVQGIKTGTAIVRSTLRDTAYPEPLVTEVTLTVIANLILWPPYEVYVPVGSIWSYEVHLIQHGKSSKIAMPSSQYYLTMTDETVAKLNAETSEVEAVSLGHTLLLLKDRNLKTKQAFRQPSVSIHVVVPHRLGLIVVPHQSWCLVAGKEYTLAVRIYSFENNEMLVTDNLQIITEFPNDHFNVLHQTLNGSHVQVKTKKVGLAKCRAKLNGANLSGKNIGSEINLEDSRDVEIVEQIEVEPREVILPWDPHSKPSYTVNLKAIGGGGYGFHWKTSNPSLSVCDQSGLVTTKAIGSVNITASSMCNLNNYGSATVSVVTPGSIEVLTPMVEIQLGSIVRIPVAIYTSLDKLSPSSKFPISDCAQYHFTLDISDPRRLEYLPDAGRSSSLKDACASLPFLANSIGLAKLTVSLANEDASSKQSSVTIVVYKPLTPVSPDNLENPILLTVGSSRRIVFEGGPKSSTSHNYLRQLNIEDRTTTTAILIDPSEMKNKDRHVFDIVCLKIGETGVALLVGSPKLTSSGKSSTAEARIHVICAYPTAIQLHPVISRPEEHQSACHLDTHSVAANCYQDLDIVIFLIDEKGRKFHNFSSLEIVWESSKPNIASFSSDDELVSIDNIHDGYTTHNRSYVMLHPNNVEGSVQIMASVQSYRQAFLLANSISSRKLSTPRVATKHFIDFVNDATFNEDAINIFNHPSNKLSVSVSKGSGQFEYQPKEQPFASIQYDDKRQQFQIVPKMEGSFMLILIDVCLKSRTPASVLVRVSGIKKVQVNLVDKVSLGKEITAIVQILDQDNQIVPFSVFKWLHIQPQVASNIISLRALPDSLSAIPEFQFRVKGESLGLTTLSFKVSRKLIFTDDEQKLDSTISSSQLLIQVFSPLKLHPRNVTLIVGAVFQVSSSGGPHPQANVEFEIKDSTVASVSSNAGIIEGMQLGLTILVGRAIGSDPETGNKVVYSEDELPVHVISLDGVRIKSPLTRVQVGSTIPIYVVGMGDHETPYAFGSAVPSLTFIWNVENKEIAVLQHVYQACGIQLSDTNHFMIRLLAKQPGQVTLSLKVVAARNSERWLGNSFLSDKIQIHVFEKLRLMTPSFAPIDIVITPSTELQLITNKDRTSVVNHRIVDSSCSNNNNNNDNDIGVDTNGLLRSGTRDCRVALMVTSTDEIGLNQSFATVVTVKPISFMMVVSECSFLVRNRNLIVVPVGAELPFRVQFYDNVGNTFHVTNSKLQFRPSRFDLVRIEAGTKNETFSIKAIGIGYTVVKVWDTENVGINDYFLISSGEIITPSRSVVLLGDRICFSCSVSTSQGSTGSWNVEDVSVLQMDVNSGYGVAIDVGTSTIIYNVSNELVTTTELTVASIEQIEFDKSSWPVKFVTNADTTKIYRFPLLMHGNIARSTVNPGVVGNCTLSESWYSPIDCSVRFENEALEDVSVFDTLQAFDLNTGRYECRLRAKIMSTVLARHWSTITGHVQVMATIRETSKQIQLTSDKLIIPFHAAFQVLTPDLQAGDHLQLQVSTSTSFIVISASDIVFQHLIIKANDSMLIEVLEPQTDAANPHQRLFAVKLSDRFRKRMAAASAKGVAVALPVAHIHVHCSLTEQTIQLPVQFIGFFSDKAEFYLDDEDSSIISKLIWIIINHYRSFTMIIAVIVTTVAVLISYRVINRQRNNDVVHQRSVYFDQSTLLGGQLLASGNGGYTVLSTPTSQTTLCDRPHLWSVREPVHGSPTLSRTPSPRFCPSDRYVMT